MNDEFGSEWNKYHYLRRKDDFYCKECKVNLRNGISHFCIECQTNNEKKHSKNYRLKHEKRNIQKH